ncbi:RrF2 family transcriptional regulator [Rahnella woolbedingensis]|uniref:Rrf2 family transcriptional regulator n=1 Tax=Rahnella woolbedingensis TaxID=1510574 RepID=A0A419N7P0_9GAMM|nr:Rrf2 family transcriptional regulator [Rahnella woolbedingensis]RJT43270.1 Rrf2 family transcriptional regulator [Rahnella woolbedingensis]
MSHISAGVEYALHCLLFIADPQGKVTDASVRDLSELQGVPFDYVAKLFTKLHKAKLIIATEGAKGGIRLARPPQEISVLEVVDAIDGRKKLFDCKEIRNRCAVFEENPPSWASSGLCAIHALMIEADDKMREVLAAQTLAGLASQFGRKAPSEFGQQVIRWLGDKGSRRIL